MANVIVMGKVDHGTVVPLYELEEGGVGIHYEESQSGGLEKRWRYHVVPDPGTPDRATTLGPGGFGAVVAAEDRLGVRRAIKFFYPLDGSRRVLAPYGGDHEKRVSNKRRFKHVVDAFDSGKEVDANGKEYEYAVSPFIDGYNLGQFRKLYVDHRKTIEDSARLRRRAHDDAISVVTDLAAGIHEMHTAGLVHMDIKPPNLRVSPVTFNPIDETQDLRLEAFLIDLGASRDINLVTGNAPVPVAFTVEFFPLHVVRELGYLTNTRTFSAEALRRLWRYIDLFCCGRTLEMMFLDRVSNKYHHYLEDQQRRLGTLKILKDETAEDLDQRLQLDEARKEEFWSTILRDDFDVLRAIIQKLLVQEPEKGFESSDELLRAVQALPRLRDRGILSSNTLTDPYPRVKIRTGNELIRFSPPYDEIIEHPVFQRLRRVQQLSFVSDIFPDGTHTRFSHSIRTFEMAKRFVWGLSRRSAFRSLFQRPNVDCLLAAALLHDIGQYHFSHCLEDLHKMGKKKNIPQLAAIEHDQVLADRMLTDGRSGDPISKILERANISLDHVKYIIQKSDNDSSDPVLRISRDIVSGIIDVDRISYLTQDSERTGVPYGRALDVETLAEALTIQWNAKEFYEKGPEQSGISLAIEAGGISAAEAVLAATYWMYRNVYWRHTNRAFMAAVKFAMRHVLMHTESTFAEYINDNWGGTDIDALRWVRRKFEPLRKSMNLTDPLEDLDLLRRISYKRVFSLPYLPVNDAPLRYLHKEALRIASMQDAKRIAAPVAELQELLKNAIDNMAQNDKIWRSWQLYRTLVHEASPELEDDLAEHIANTFLSNYEVRKGDILIDIPLKSRLDDLEPGLDSVGESQSEAGPKKATITIALRSPITRRITGWRDLKEYSRLAGEFGRAEAYNGRKVRVFFSSALARGLTQQEKERIEMEMFDTLYRRLFA